MHASFGALLRRLRTQAGLTQEALAAASGVGVRTISDLERGLANRPRAATLAQLVTALQLAPETQALLEASARQLPRGGAVSAMPRAGLARQSQAAPGPLAPPLVGRTAELAAIERLLATAHPPTLFLAGEPGIGKSRLLAEAALRAQARGWMVLVGGCTRRSGQEPYAPLLGAFSRCVAALPPSALRTSLDGCAWLVRLLPELAERVIAPAPTWTLPPEHERRLMHAAAGRFVANVAGPAGTLLVLDDLQWAGEDALDLLADLLHAAPDGSLRILGAYRSTEVPASHRLATLLADLAREGQAEPLALGPLKPNEARALLASLLSEAGALEHEHLTEPLLARGGGVPFFLVSCARAVAIDAASQHHDEAGAELPWTVLQSIRQRVAALPPSAQELLSVAAFIGRRSPRALLIAVAAHLGHNMPTAINSIEAACQARLLAEDGDRVYVFTHDLIREAVYRDISAARRAILHGVIAHALERAHQRGEATRLPETPTSSQLAYHFSRAEMPERAIIYLEPAGDEAQARCAYNEAQQYFQDLASTFETLNRPLDAAHARAKLGDALRGAARYDEAVGVLQRAVDTYSRAGDHDAAGRVLAQLGSLQAVRGAPHEGVAQLRAFLERPETAALQPTILATIFLALSQLYRVSGQYIEMLAAAESAASQAATHDPGLHAKAEQDRGTALLMLGSNEEGAQALEAAIPGLEALDDPIALARALNTLSVVREAQGNFARARHILDRANAYAERSGDPTLIAFMLNRRATNAFARGHWQEARADFQRALATLHQVGSSWANPYPLIGMGRLELAMGHSDTATRYLDEAATLADRQGDIQAQHNVAYLRAEADMLNNDARAVLERLAPLYARTQQQSDVALLMPPLIWAYDITGETQRADALLEYALRRGATPQGRLELSNVRRVQARVAARRGDWDVAETACLESLTLCRQIGLPYNEVRALFVLGKIYAAKGATEQAREPLRLAKGICAQLGERLYATHIEQAMDALGA